MLLLLGREEGDSVGLPVSVALIVLVHRSVLGLLGPLLVDESEEECLVLLEVRGENHEFPKRIDVFGLDCDCPVALDDDKLQEVKKLLQQYMVASLAYEDVVLNILWCAHILLN